MGTEIKTKLLATMRKQMVRIMTMQDYKEDFMTTGQHKRSAIINTTNPEESNIYFMDKVDPKWEQTKASDTNQETIIIEKEQQKQTPSNNRTGKPTNRAQHQTHTQKQRSQNINLPRRPRFATRYTRSQPRRNTNPTTTIANITTQSTTQQLENDYSNNQQQIQWTTRQPIRGRPQDQEPRPNIARCVYCEKIGHYIYTCFTLKAYREGRRRIIPGKCKICLRQYNTKCKEGICHIVVNTRGLTPKNEDLRCQQHKEINYLTCNNERCRQLLERKKQENTQRNYNNPQRYQRNTRDTLNNYQRRQNSNRRPERPQVTFANILHVTQPREIPAEVINNTRIRPRKHTPIKNKYQPKTNVNKKQMSTKKK